MRTNIIYLRVTSATRITLIVVICLLSISCFHYIHHDEEMAAEAAVKFAKLAFIDRDYGTARELLPTEVDQQFDAEKLKKFVENMHPDGFPTKVTATEYEPIPGTESMSIFLMGENDAEKIYYRFTVRGTSETGYKIYELYSKLTPYPPTNLKRPLPQAISTN